MVLSRRRDQFGFAAAVVADRVVADAGLRRRRNIGSRRPKKKTGRLMEAGREFVRKDSDPTQGQTWMGRSRYPAPSTQTRRLAQWHPGASSA
jgi:DNA-binding protein H-NS